MSLPASGNQPLSGKTGLSDDPAKLASGGRYSDCASAISKPKIPNPALDGLLEQCSFYAGDYRLTLETSRRAVQSNSHSLDAWFWEAKSAQQLSASSFSQMNAVAPDSPKMHLLMAELHRAREEYAAAEDEYNEALKSPDSGEDKTSARLGLAFVYLHSSQDEKALEQLQSVLNTDSGNSDANFMMGQVLVRRHQYDEAAPHLKQAITKLSSASLPEAHSLLAKCYSAQGDYARALEELKPALPADTMGAFHYQLYQLYQNLGDSKSADRALQQSEELRKTKASAEQQHVQFANEHPE